MEEKLKIKVSIADRVYPLTVGPEQEEGIRAAVKKIEAMTLQLEENFAMRDKQDVLAFCALQFAFYVEICYTGLRKSTNSGRSDHFDGREKGESLDDILLKYHIK